MAAVGVQLYSVRELCAQDLPGALRQMKAIGYDAVEFAGYYDRSVADLRRMLQDNGLTCCGTHIRVAALAADKLAEVIAFHRTLGCEYLIVPYLPREKRDSAEAIAGLARWFNDLARTLAREGMKTGYHAHADDFDKIGDRSGYELLFEALSPEVVMQLDTGNTASAGVDPLAVLRRFPGRSQSVHLKEFGGGPETAIGEGAIPWQEVIHFCQTQGDTRHFVVESEVKNANAVEVLRRCRVALRSYGL